MGDKLLTFVSNAFLAIISVAAVSHWRLNSRPEVKNG